LKGSLAEPTPGADDLEANKHRLASQFTVAQQIKLQDEIPENMGIFK